MNLPHLALSELRQNFPSATSPPHDNFFLYFPLRATSGLFLSPLFTLLSAPHNVQFHPQPIPNPPLPSNPTIPRTNLAHSTPPNPPNSSNLQHRQNSPNLLPNKLHPSLNNNRWPQTQRSNSGLETPHNRRKRPSNRKFRRNSWNLAKMGYIRSNIHSRRNISKRRH